jgi:hypothetical protein
LVARAACLGVATALALGVSGCHEAADAAAPPEELLPLEAFFALFDRGKPGAAAVDRVFEAWHPAYASILVEAALYSPHRGALLERLGRVAGEDFAADPDRAYRWLWAREPLFHPRYAQFKGALYRQFDPRFARYFDGAGDASRIRLDEIRWGGVARDGIPPLVRPAMIAAPRAGYLKDDNIVFGLEIDGDARAYPRRILAWHEMFKDTVGGVSVNGVYCTLCGTMILYRTEFDGRHHELGTSGFLYRSNKLMYDRETNSLWSTIHGEPVLGPLADSGIRLEALSVVTTTWGRWRALHPDTQVLSLATGFDRDYAEGAAYRDYFATDDLMFAVPFADRRLRNKDEVLALRFGGADAPPIAIDAGTLQARRPLHGEYAGISYVVLTDSSGAHRVYRADGIMILEYDGGRRVTDSAGDLWQIREDALAAADGRRRERLPAHRAFWFGWHAAHPDTRLIRAGATAAVAEPVHRD